MNNPETVSESFIQWLESQGIGVFNTDIFLNQVPQDAPADCYRVTTSGGNIIQTLRTGEKVKQYFTSIYYRNKKAQLVERNLFALEELINKPQCLELQGFEIISIEANTFATDEDLDSEERSIALLQVNIQIYKKD